MSDFQQIQSLYEQARLGVLVTVLEAQKLIAKELATISQNSVFSAARTAGSDAFKLEKEPMQKHIDKLKEELSSRQNSEFKAKLAELRQTYDANMRALKEKLRDHSLFIEALQ